MARSEATGLALSKGRMLQSKNHEQGGFNKGKGRTATAVAGAIADPAIAEEAANSSQVPTMPARPPPCPRDIVTSQGVYLHKG